MTNRNIYSVIRDLMTNSTNDAFTLGDESITPDEIIEWCDTKIAQLDKKASTPSKPTKTQIENEGFKQSILDYLAIADRPVTISEMMTECEALAGLKNQRVSAIVTQLKKGGQVVRTEVKKVAYFSLAE